MIMGDFESCRKSKDLQPPSWRAGEGSQWNFRYWREGFCIQVGSFSQGFYIFRYVIYIYINIYLYIHIYIHMCHSRHQFLGIARLFCFQHLEKLDGRSRNASRSVYLVRSSPLYLEALDEFWYSTAVPLVERTRVGTCASRLSVNTLRGIQSDASCHDTKGSQLMFKRCVPLSSDCGIL